MIGISSAGLVYVLPTFIPKQLPLKTVTLRGKKRKTSAKEEEKEIITLVFGFFRFLGRGRDFGKSS